MIGLAQGHILFIGVLGDTKILWFCHLKHAYFARHAGLVMW